jgi:hypothetical protein
VEQISAPRGQRFDPDAVEVAKNLDDAVLI